MSSSIIQTMLRGAHASSGIARLCSVSCEERQRRQLTVRATLLPWTILMLMSAREFRVRHAPCFCCSSSHAGRYNQLFDSNAFIYDASRSHSC